MRGSFLGLAVVTQMVALLSGCWEVDAPPLGAAEFEAFVQLDLPDPSVRGPYEVAVESNVGANFANLPSESERSRLSTCDPAAPPAGAAGLDESLYTVYRPARFQSGVLYPVVAWASALCRGPDSYTPLLSHIASHGFIVIAPNARWNGTGEPQRRGVDWVLRQNGDPQSPLYGRVNGTQIAGVGHAQGGAAAASRLGADLRVDTTVMLNGGGTRGILGSALFVTGERDPMADDIFDLFSQAELSSAFVNVRSADDTAAFAEPEKVQGVLTAWLRYQLWGDAAARAWFVGSDCALCSRTAELDFLQKELP